MIQTKLKEDPQIKCNLTHKYSKDVFVFCNAVRAGPTIEAKRMISFDNQKKGSVKPIHWPESDIKLISSMCSDHNVMCRGNGLELRKLKNKK